MFSQRRTDDANRDGIERENARFAPNAVGAEKFLCFFGFNLCLVVSRLNFRSRR